ncbi:MAG: AAA family ATPase, partial [Neptuniibacter sp.]
MITVLAGVNGAGKSSIAGAQIRNKGGEYFNPDECSRQLMLRDSSISTDEANGQAWNIGRQQLERAISGNKDYIFETTLGGNSIAGLLHKAIDEGVGVRIFFCGLNSPELHIERVAARVSKGGHDIPEQKIRERWVGSIKNMENLIPRCEAVQVYDNSEPLGESGPNIKLLFSVKKGKIVSNPVSPIPKWCNGLMTP